jgi:hypothetical protein
MKLIHIVFWIIAFANFFSAGSNITLALSGHGGVPNLIVAALNIAAVILLCPGRNGAPCLLFKILLRLYYSRARIEAKQTPEPEFLKGWHMAYCPVHDSNWMYMPNEPNNRECPQCQTDRDDRARKLYGR